MSVVMSDANDVAIPRVHMIVGTWQMNERVFWLALYSNGRIAFSSEDGRSNVSSSASGRRCTATGAVLLAVTWTEPHGLWLRFGNTLCLFFNYRGGNYARRMASITWNVALQCFTGIDYQERAIIFTLVYACHPTGEEFLSGHQLLHVVLRLPRPLAAIQDGEVVELH